MSWHRVSPSPFLSYSSHTTQLQYTNSYTCSHPNLNFQQHCTDTLPTRNVVCPSGAWTENRPCSMPSIRLEQNPKHEIAQWVGIGNTHISYWIILVLFSQEASRAGLDTKGKKNLHPSHNFIIRVPAAILIEVFRCKVVPFVNISVICSLKKNHKICSWFF